MAIKPFYGSAFLGAFELSLDYISFPDSVFVEIDHSIREHIAFGNRDLEDFLISKTEFLSTFSTAKAEEVNSLSTLEAEKIVGSFLGFDKEQKVTHAASSNKEFDELEFKNILRGFRSVCEKGLSIDELSTARLKDLHSILTQGLDILGRYVRGSEPDFNSGSFRQDDKAWIGGIFATAPYQTIEDELSAAVQYLRNNPSIADCFIFSSALYAVHPFSNGNKRVCRIMEHGLLRSLGINQANMYSHIVETYHNLDRYKDAIKASLSRKILNNLVNMQLESLFWSQMQTLRASVEFDRRKLVEEFLKSHSRKYVVEMLESLVSTKAMQYKEIKKSLAGISDKVLATLLSWCQSQGVIRKSVRGKESFYCLAIDSRVEHELWRFYADNKKRVTYTPDDFYQSILKHSELFSEDSERAKGRGHKSSAF